MDEWVADNLKEYVSKAIKFSSNFKYLSDVRLNLREKALKSPVFNSQRFSEHFSKLLWDMWEIYDRKNCSFIWYSRIAFSILFSHFIWGRK